MSDQFYNGGSMRRAGTLHAAPSGRPGPPRTTLGFRRGESRKAESPENRVLTIVLRGHSSQFRPNRIARFQKFRRQRTVFQSGQILPVLVKSRSAQNHAVGLRMTVNPVQRHAEKRTVVDAGGA